MIDATTVSLALIRKAYWDTWQNSYEQQLDLEARLQNQAGASSDFAEGVSAFPQEVTPQMVANFIHGGAGINVLARHAGVEVRVADMGVAVPVEIGCR